MHSSLFSYNITKPFPFRWFTPTIVVGGTVAVVLFSILNFISSGYSLIVHSSSNPNATVSQGIWFNNWPSYLTSKTQPTCQSVDLQVNGQFLTNQSALTYALTSVWQSIMNNTSENISPSLTYHNNVLQDCVVNSIEVDMEAMDRLANQFSWAEWGAKVKAFCTCSIDGSTGRTHFNMTASYDYVPETVSFSSGLYTFIGRDRKRKASLYWGESLLSMYWAYLSRTMQDIRVNDTDGGVIGIRKGTIYFTPNNRSISDITSLDYFDVDYRFIQDQGYGRFDVIFPGDNTSFVHTISNLATYQTHPNIWIQADSLAKSAYSTILTDLGQVQARSNILTNETALRYFTSNFSVALQHIANAHPGPAQQDYDTLKTATGPLGLTPSVLSTKYICQVPQRKSAGNLFVSILVADLVFLQALWQLFKMGTEFFFLRKEKAGPDVNYCEGCRIRDGFDGLGYIDSSTSELVNESQPHMVGKPLDGLRGSNGRGSRVVIRREMSGNFI